MSDEPDRVKVGKLVWVDEQYGAFVEDLGSVDTGQVHVDPGKVRRFSLKEGDYVRYRDKGVVETNAREVTDIEKL